MSLGKSGHVLIAVVLWGCAIGPNFGVSIGYEPSGAAPLAQLPSRSIHLEMSDGRARLDVGAVLVLGSEVGRVYERTSVLLAVRDAIAAELRASGHRVGLSAQDSDRTVHIELERCWTEARPSGAALAVIDVRVTIEGAGSGAEPAERLFIGTAEAWRRPWSSPPYERALNMALRDLMRSFARDEVILRALSQRGRQPQSAAPRSQ